MLHMSVDSKINGLCNAAHVVVLIGAELEGSLPSFVYFAIRGFTFSSLFGQLLSPLSLSDLAVI
jgi:hypothetical protein